MRSPQAFVEEYGERSGYRLSSLFWQFFAWYVLAILILNNLGIEPIYQHVTPFYAVWLPASSFATPTVAPVLVALFAFVVTTWAIGMRIERRARLALLVIAFAILLIVAYSSDSTRRGMTGAEFWSAFKWHLPLIALISLTSIAMVRFFRGCDWWGSELSGKTAWKVVAAIAFFSFLFSGSMALIREGTGGIAAAYSRSGYEYIDDIGKGLTLFGFLREYNELHPHLSMHAKVHPPGPVVILWIMSTFMLSRDPLILSIGTMALGSAAVFPLFAWVRDMINQRVAITCCAFYTLMPSIALFTATSADITFLPLIFLTLLLFWRALHRNSWKYAVGAGLMYAVLSLTSFSLLTLGAFFAFVGLWRLADPATRGAVIKTAIIMFASFILAHLAVRAGTGFDIIRCFALSHGQFLEDQRQLDHVSPRYSSWAFKFFNPMCWIFFAGIPATILWFWRLYRPEQGTRALFIVFGLTLLILTPLYLARGEGERSAMYILPFVVLPAAHLLDELGAHSRSFRSLAAVFLFLVIQTWIIETHLYTYW
ncbi:MAG TPA: glycosyltransferase family 39 protein [Candidatus Hydrogenedentes bacterium]|nr:glycosyltransferase family 39 protein [Candidatus Hydrogenedentota bacterium]